MTISINIERPDSDESIQLIDELEAILTPLYPEESRHGYDVGQLLQDDVTFFVIQSDDVPAGCGAVHFFGTDYAELKRMYVRPDFRGQGLGKQLVDHLCDYSLQHGITSVRLETGILQKEAIGLYESMGFQRIDPFGDYQPDPLSIFYEKDLAFHVERCTSDDIQTHINGLTDLLCQVVDAGASVGFLMPLDPIEAKTYWEGIAESTAKNERITLLAFMDNQVVGTVQIALPAKANAAHRVEIQKLMVHGGWRRRGIARRLMDKAETIIRTDGYHLAFLDTERGSGAVTFYEGMGYLKAGIIPDYALDNTGQRYVDTVLYYKLFGE